MNALRGEASFEMVDALDGRPGVERAPIAGRTLENFDPMSGDVVRHTVTWNGGSDLSTWCGRPVRLSIRMRRARLHSARFS